MNTKIISCSFVVLYEHGTVGQLKATLDSVADFVRSKPQRHCNPFDLLVVVGDSKRGDVPPVPQPDLFENADFLDRSQWTLPGEGDFGPWPIAFNLANIALKRTPMMAAVMMLACGSRIANNEAAADALTRAYKDEGLAVLSARRSQGGQTLIPNGIIFKYSAGWTNLATAMDGTLVEIRKRFFGKIECRTRGVAEPTAFSDSDVIAAIAYDYQRNRHGYSERAMLSEWAL